MKPKIGDLIERKMLDKPNAVWYYCIISDERCLLIAWRHYVDDVFHGYAKDASLGPTHLERGYEFRHDMPYVDGDMSRILSSEEVFELSLQLVTANVQI